MRMNKLFRISKHPNNKVIKEKGTQGLQLLNKKQLEDAKSIALDLF